MSSWTHIVASIDVDTYIEDKNIKDVVVDKLKNAPKITGSERNAEVFVNVLSGHNVSTSCDCNSCKYKDTIFQTDEGWFCEPEDGFFCPEGEYQTRVVITIIGDLRDKFKDKTEKEYKKFIEFIKEECDFEIRNESVSIIED